MKVKFAKLGAALDRECYDWLLTNNEDIAAAVEAEVSAGASPDEIRRFILNHVGADRSGLAARAQSAARHLHAMKVKA